MKVWCVNPLNPVVHSWLRHNVQCTEKIVSACLHTGSASAERVEQGEVGGVIRRVLCTWWLLGSALKRPWLVSGGPPHALTAWPGLENTSYSHLAEGWFLARKAAWSLSGCQLVVLTITCSLMSGCGQSHETAY